MCLNRPSALLAIAGLLVALMATPASAWEFTMKGAWSWEVELVGQQGAAGFFGPYDVDAGSGVAGTGAGYFAPYNFWVGQLGYRMVSGSDASWNTQYMTVLPEIRMNQALRVRGIYYVGAWNPPNNAATANLVASEMFAYNFGGIQQSFSPGYWNALWLSAQLPWGIVTFGKRPSSWGMGLQWNGEFTRSSESLALTAPYGPLRISLSFYPSRNATATRNLDGRGDYYNADYDKNDKRAYEVNCNVSYRSGPLDVGVQAVTLSVHRGGERVITTPASRMGNAMRDRIAYYGGVYLKYYTGTIFLNSELDWYHRTDRIRDRSAGGAIAPGVTDKYAEHWRTATELGVLAGPARLGLLWATATGGDRRGNNTLPVNQIDRNGILRIDVCANTGVFKPYSYLQVYSYGLGNFIDATSGYGYLEDANVYGARLDYAVAANLNLYGTYFWAERQTKSGFGWGCIYPEPTTTNPNGSVVFGSNDPNNNNNGGQGPTGAPNIPDTFLGWEVDLGLDWKLLEGLTLSTTFAYWQPGEWYKYACRDKNVPNWGNPPAVPNSTNPADWGINPDRSIDPVWGLRFLVNGEF